MPLCLCSSCKGASHYGLTKDRKRRSQDGCPDGCASLTATTLSPEVSAAATISLMTDEPGLDNPAYASSVEDGEPVTNPSDTGRSNRTRGESNGRVSGNGHLVFPGIALCKYLWWKVLEMVFKGQMGSGSFGSHSMSSSPRGNETVSDRVI